MFLILCDGGKSGYGHIRRSMALAWELKNAGHMVKVSCLNPSIQNYIPDFPSDVGAEEVVIIDVPCEAKASESIKHFRSKGKKVATLEYYGDVNHSLMIEVFGTKCPRHSTLVKSGLKYAMIRKDIQEARNTTLYNINDYVVIIMGGSDIQNQGESIAQSISERGYRTILVRGPLTINNATVSNRFEVLENPANLPEWMSNCLFAVTNGGVTLLEMLHLGKPVYVVPQTNAELSLAEFLMKKGAILGIGLPNHVNLLSQNIDQVGKIGESIIDGQGLSRIRKILEEL